MYIKSNINYEIRTDLTKVTSALESIAVDIKMNNQTYTILNIYRPPKNEQLFHTSFINEIECLLRAIKQTKNTSYLMGDCNYDLIDLENNAICNFKDIMLSFSYRSLINKPTRIQERHNINTDTIRTSATCLDQIWTTNENTNITGAIITYSMSDHYPVCK